MKLFTLDRQLVIRKAGVLADTDRNQVRKALRNLLAAGLRG
jgi:hypothetical protein